MIFLTGADSNVCIANLEKNLLLKNRGNVVKNRGNIVKNRGNREILRRFIFFLYPRLGVIYLS